MTAHERPGDSFPRQQARTQRFTLGRPRDVTVTPDGSRICFLRSDAGDDPVNCLWVLDVDTMTERLVLDPRKLGEDNRPEHETAEERARRERARERARGIVSYATDRAFKIAAVTLGGELWLADLLIGDARPLPATGPVFDPRPSPDGRVVAYVCGSGLRVVDVASGEDRALAPPTSVAMPTATGDEEDIRWGAAEFIAAEEMGRYRGFWWSPDSQRLAVTRVDDSPVAVWHLSDPGDPSAPSTPIRYPAAGTANADVGLHVIGLDGAVAEVSWDKDALPYLARVLWDDPGGLVLAVQARDQRTVAFLSADPATGTSKVLRQQHDDRWVDLVPGSPSWSETGGLVTVERVGDVRGLVVGGSAVGPEALDVRAVLDTSDPDSILFAGSTEPTEVQVWRATIAGGTTNMEAVTDAPGVHSAAGGGEVMVVFAHGLDREPTVTVWRGHDRIGDMASVATAPPVVPSINLLSAGASRLRTAVLLPSHPTAGQRPPGSLPVLLDPYGGPGHQRVLKDRRLYLEAQWVADQGFAVVIADGRGTGGRGVAWDRAVHGDLAGPPLDDQVEALHAAAARHPELDLSRVAIRGWSFGGFLAALAVLRRPDVFHAAIAGAPVTDWSLYDTHYTERFLGLPSERPEAYERSSLLADAPNLHRPLLLIHGLGDDNVVAAHTFKLSQALTDNGRLHTVLPLSGVTHLAGGEKEAENLLLLQLAFLRQSLGL